MARFRSSSVCWFHSRELHVGIVEAALEKEIGERLHQILGIDAEIFPGVFGKLDPLHRSQLPCDLVELTPLPRPRVLFRFRRGALPLFSREAALFGTADPPVRIADLRE